MLAWLPFVLGLTLAAALGCADVAGQQEGSRPAARAGGARLLEGRLETVRRQLSELRGRPVVVNQWASWCPPCRNEFPWFARLARRYDRRVAFLGVASLDTRPKALAFLRRHPTPFPHFFDPDGKIGPLFYGGRVFPSTAFYRADGDFSTVHKGAYRSEAALERDIRRYALDG
jgi:thiol-disulfide isomerase/thioredoxin